VEDLATFSKLLVNVSELVFGNNGCSKISIGLLKMRVIDKQYAGDFF